MSRESLIDWNLYPCGANSQIYSHLKKRMLKGSFDEDGYVVTMLKCVDGKYRRFRWHRVIYTYFNGAIPEGYEVNHIDENKQNNVLSNLNLMTRKENANWGTRTERAIEKLKKPVVAVDKDNNVVYEFASTNEVERQMNYSHSHISKCCRNCYLREGNRFFKGYYWYYKEDYLKINGG